MNPDEPPIESPPPAEAPPPAVTPPAGPPAAAWGAPLLRLDQAWTRFETGLVVLVIGLEAFALTLWVFLKGFSTPAGGDSAAGTVFRGITGAFVLGMIAFHGLRKKPENVRRGAAIAATLLGFLLAKSWAHFGVEYSSNLLNWYQQGSTLTLFGGLRGIGTRLTLLLALLGGSLATASGKHITIDFLTRFLSAGSRVAVVLVGWVGAAIICAVGSWGFFDHIAIENFGARADATVGQKFSKVGEGLDESFFILRKQVALDLKTVPHVVFRGEVYADWLGGAEWNSWLEQAGFAERYGKESLERLHVPENETRAPFVIVPGKGEPRGELIHPANLVFPIGLLIIALRFILRSLLVLSGQVGADPDAGGEFTSDRTPEAAR